MRATICMLMAGLFFSTATSQADWRDLLGIGKKTAGTADATSVALTSLSQEQVAQGLKEALAKGVQTAVSQLGRDGGFLTNLNVKIPMPQQLRKVETTLRTLKQDKLADEFVATMNHAAEQAVPEAATVFSDAVKNMTLEDAKSILTGGDDAATKYFRRNTETNLQARFLPIVQSATAKAGVTQSYKRVLSAAKQNKYLGALSNAYLDSESVDIDRYVTDKALDGLFKVVAQEEKAIRANPVARTSELLQKVFGAATGAAK